MLAIMDVDGYEDVAPMLQSCIHTTVARHGYAAFEG